MCCQDHSFISVVPASTEYQLAMQALTDEIHQRRDAVLHRSHRHQRSSSERKENTSRHGEQIQTKAPR